MRQLKTQQRDFAKQWQQYLNAVAEAPRQVTEATSTILQAVKKRGDSALFQFTKKFDGFTANARSIRISPAQVERAVSQVSSKHLNIFKRAAQRIRKFHQLQKQRDYRLNQNGAKMGLRWTPLDRVGIYVPGGRAAYPSTVLMNTIPAQVAGVTEIAMVTPAPGGEINPYTLAAAHVAGVEEIYRIGGAQAIGALAYGTKTIPAVNKIVGPGNAYVAAAKQQVFGRVDIDMIAGPTEVLVIADAQANPEYVAADLLSQAEHDPDARPVLICTSVRILEKSLQALTRQVAQTPRKKIAQQAIRKNGLAILAKNQGDAIALSNQMAPEHLVIMVKKPASWMKKLKNAGAIFIGNYAPVAAGDYLVGPNHVLPTARTAQYASPLGVYDFMKASSWLELTRKGLAQVSADIIELAELEGLSAHGYSVKVRFTE